MSSSGEYRWFNDVEIEGDFTTARGETWHLVSASLSRFDNEVSVAGEELSQVNFNAFAHGGQITGVQGRDVTDLMMTDRVYELLNPDKVVLNGKLTYNLPNLFNY